MSRKRKVSTNKALADNLSLLTDETEICGCNGICKGDITSAIRKKGLSNLDEVIAHTKAGASCGLCSDDVAQLLATTTGIDLAATPAKQTICNCSDYDHDEVRAAILEQEIMTIPDLFQALAWKQPDGCAKCRMAVNYYLLCAWPSRYQDDAQSRFINERVHANIQKDGRYSVVPRMIGGTCTPDELRAIADVVDKFKVPEIKVTGGQRIALFGIKKEQLPAVWADLNKAGMSSGHAYGKSLRTVKSCIGDRWCRFGTQDSVTMAVELEKMSLGSWTPAKFKMAASGCPRNCAEATIKDFGVVAVDSGWALHIGGNGGITVRATELLCKVKTDEAVLEYAAAFMQLYREQGYYTERTAPWVRRVGLTHIKQQLVENATNRQALAERFHYAQQFSQADPWQERVEGTDAHEFAPLSTINQ